MCRITSGSVWAAAPLIGPDERFDRGHLGQHLLHNRVERIFDDEHLAFRVVDAKIDIRPAQQIVDRQIDRADFAASQPGQHVMQGVVRQDGHPVVLGHTQIRQRVGGPVGSGFQLLIGQALVTEDKGCFLGIVIGRAPDHVGDHPAVDAVIAVHEKFQVLFVE